MLVGVSQKYDFGWNVHVEKFKNLESAEFWLNKEQNDFRVRLIFDDEEEAIKHLKKLNGVEWAKETLKDAPIHTLIDDELYTELSLSDFAKQMGWD